MARHDRLYNSLRKPKSLRKAWAKIYENGQRSESQETQKLVNEYKQNEEEQLNRLAKKLHKKDFNFGPIQGVAAKKKTGKLRPLVSASIEARIVQRAILDELSKRKEIKKYFLVKTSFGAIPEKGVSLAIKEAVKAIQAGAKYYIKSDIADFFTKIPRASVVTQIANFWNDNEFGKLLEKTTNMEIANLADLERRYGAEFRDKFIFDKTGAPQGCCLSPLIGNILLYEFDDQMNSQDVTCLRYLDDFIIFGPSYRAVRGAYKKAQRLLGIHALQAYDLASHPDKASQGTTDKSFEFLGVEFKGKLIRPSMASRNRLMASIGKILGEVLETNDKNRKAQTLVNALYLISNKIRGWGNQYKFCNDVALVGSIDAEIAGLIVPYFFKFSKSLGTLDQSTQRKLIGVWSLKDCKHEPINF